MSKNQISRRTFIKGLAAGAASVATSGHTFTPGTYTSTAKGISSDVTVIMTFGRHAAKLLAAK